MKYWQEQLKPKPEPEVKEFKMPKLEYFVVVHETDIDCANYGFETYEKAKEYYDEQQPTWQEMYLVKVLESNKEDDNGTNTNNF